LRSDEKRHLRSVIARPAAHVALRPIALTHRDKSRESFPRGLCNCAQNSTTSEPDAPTQTQGAHMPRAVSIVSCLLIASCFNGPPKSLALQTCTDASQCAQGQACRADRCVYPCQDNRSCSSGEVCAPSGTCEQAAAGLNTAAGPTITAVE